MPNYKRYYIENKYIFITVVTYNRNPILIQHIDLLRDCFRETLKKFDFEIFGSVILPEHFHIIIKPKDSKEDNFSKIIGTLKRKFTQSLNRIGAYDAPYSPSQEERKEKPVWQRRFYEHIIRNEKDLYSHLDYIHYNPVKHGYVKSVKDWEYSSFGKFVKLKNYEIDWGNQLKDIKNLETLEYE